jgi:hypothetical protein
VAEGYVALYLSDAPVRWPGAFLQADPIPPELSESMRQRLVKAGPELEVSSMVPRSIDIGLIPGLAEDAMETFERLPLLRTILAWTFFLGLLAALFWYTHR